MSDPATQPQLADWQQAVVDSSDRYLIVQAGPAAGKTHAVLSAIAKRVTENADYTCVYCGHKPQRAADMLTDMLLPMHAYSITRTGGQQPSIHLGNGSRVEFISSPADAQGLRLGHATVDKDVPVDVRLLSVLAQDGITLTLSDRWSIIKPDPGWYAKQWEKRFPDLPEHERRRMYEGNWSEAE